VTCGYERVNTVRSDRELCEVVLLRPPRTARGADSRNTRVLTWREEWLRQGRNSASEPGRDRVAKLSAHVETKEQYLGLVEDLLQTAAHLPLWAIEGISDGFVSKDELVEC